MYPTTLILLSASYFAAVLAGKQAVGARGTLMCGDKPLAGATVKLWELDHWPNPDDVLMETTTDSQGRFQVQGSKSEFTSIRPVLKFYHRCNNKGIFNIPNICKRKNVYEIPKSYIVSGSTATKYYEMGTINMEAKQKGEGTECIGK